MRWATNVRSFFVIERREEVFQIGVHDPLPSALDLLPHLAQRVLRRAPSPISKVGFIEYRLEDRFQPIEQRLLAYPVTHVGIPNIRCLPGWPPAFGIATCRTG